MLQITTDEIELYDEKKEEFIHIKPQTLYLEHSLISISKWEAKWNKPFLDKNNKTVEEIKDYIRCMNTSGNTNPMVFDFLSEQNLKDITEYINLPMTATWFADDDKPHSRREIVTSELIYYWMIAYNIPSEYQKWHINRLMTLIKVCNEKNKDPKKMSQKSILDKNRLINEARRAKMGTKG